MMPPALARDDPRFLQIADGLGLAPDIVHGCYRALVAGARDLESIAQFHRIPVEQVAALRVSFKRFGIKYTYPSEAQLERRRTIWRESQRRSRARRARETCIDGVAEIGPR